MGCAFHGPLTSSSAPAVRLFVPQQRRGQGSPERACHSGCPWDTSHLFPLALCSHHQPSFLSRPLSPPTSLPNRNAMSHMCHDTYSSSLVQVKRNWWNSCQYLLVLTWHIQILSFQPVTNIKKKLFRMYFTFSFCTKSSKSSAHCMLTVWLNFRWHLPSTESTCGWWASYTAQHGTQVSTSYTRLSLTKPKACWFLST